MDKQTTTILAKSPSSYGESLAEPVPTEPPKKVYNAVTMAAHKEAQKIMSGEKKTKSYSSAEEFLADLKA